VVVGVLAGALLVGCNAQGRSGSGAASLSEPAPTTLGAVAAPRLPALHGRVRPDVLVTGRLTGREVKAVSSLAPSAVAFRVGTLRIGTAAVHVASVDPATFRRFAAAGTAEATALWQAVAADQLVASHDVAARLHLALGRDVALRGTRSATVRLGGLATTGIPGTGVQGVAA